MTPGHVVEQRTVVVEVVGLGEQCVGGRLTAIGLDGSMWCWNWTRHERIVNGVIPGIQAQNGRPWLSDCGRRMAMMKSDGLMVWDVQGFARTCLIGPPGSMGEAVAFDRWPSVSSSPPASAGQGRWCPAT